VLHVADYLRINRPWIGAPGSMAEIANDSGDGAAGDKITSFGQTPNGSENSTSEVLRKPGDKVAEAVKGQGDSIFERTVVHLSYEQRLAGTILQTTLASARFGLDLIRPNAKPTVYGLAPLALSLPASPKRADRRP
jgi:hypothetical protein